MYPDVASHVGGVTGVFSAEYADQPGVLAPKLLVDGPPVLACSLARR